LKLMLEQEVHMLARTVTSNMIVTTTVEGKWNALRNYLSGCVNLQNILSNERTTGNKVHLEKLSFPQLVKKFPAFYGTRGLVAIFTRSAPPVALSWARIIQSMPRSSMWYLSGRFPH
jgi:hypothetical protein